MEVFSSCCIAEKKLCGCLELCVLWKRKWTPGEKQERRQLSRCKVQICKAEAPPAPWPSAQFSSHQTLVVFQSHLMADVTFVSPRALVLWTGRSRSAFLSWSALTQDLESPVMSWAVKGHYNGLDNVTNCDFSKSGNPKPVYWIFSPVLTPEEGLILPSVKGPELVVCSHLCVLPTDSSVRAGKLKYSPWSVSFVSSVVVHFRISIIAFSAEKQQRFLMWACGLLVYHRDWKFLSWTFLLFPRKMNWNLQMVPGSQFHISWSRTCITNKENLLVYLLDTAICKFFS